MCDLEEDGNHVVSSGTLSVSLQGSTSQMEKDDLDDSQGEEGDLGVEDVGEARHAAAHGLVLLLFWVPGCHEERGEPACLSALAPPCPNRHQVQGVPQTLTVVPGTEKGRWETWVL